MPGRPLLKKAEGTGRANPDQGRFFYEMGRVGSSLYMFFNGVSAAPFRRGAPNPPGGGFLPFRHGFRRNVVNGLLRLHPYADPRWRAGRLEGGPLYGNLGDCRRGGWAFIFAMAPPVASFAGRVPTAWELRAFISWCIHKDFSGGLFGTLPASRLFHRQLGDWPSLPMIAALTRRQPFPSSAWSALLLALGVLSNPPGGQSGLGAPLAVGSLCWESGRFSICASYTLPPRAVRRRQHVGVVGWCISRGDGLLCPVWRDHVRV